ncbi:accessory gene regulator ArgB-like protein [Brevibacillus sp. B_LB10_24]|uniref:accessory gene regulator ArgB-like protein n=1 Tax=Brevibacillus sp. B_LB10_24 TaxID=3380645 RepID=UPI0038B81C20
MFEISIHKMGQAVGSYVAQKASRLEQAEMLSYGAEILLGSVVKLTLLFSVAAFLHITYEVTVLLIVTGLVRILSGGAHCSAYYRCLITSIVVLAALGSAVKLMQPWLSVLPSIVLYGVILLSLYLYWRYAPQAPPNKPFENKASELTFRRCTLLAVVALSIVSIIVGPKNFMGWTMATALLWQAFTLTPVGHKFIGSWDILLSPKPKGGEVKW